MIRPSRGWLVMIALTVTGAAAGWLLKSPAMPQLPVTKVTIAVPKVINSATMIVASAQGLFRKAGVEVISKPFPLGKDALKSVIEGETDLAVVADTPLMFALLGGNELVIVAGISQSRRSLAIVTRNDRGIDRIDDLSGKTVGLSVGTNLTYFLDMILQNHGVPSDNVELVDLNTEEVISAFKTGRVDAAVVFQPNLGRLTAELGDRIKVFYGEDVYSFRFMLTGKASYVDSHTQEIRRILSALVAAEQSIRNHPTRASIAVGNAVGADATLMSKVFDPGDYVVSLDQSMLLALDDQSRWAMQRGLVNPGPVPNYLSIVRYQHLEAVLPSAVKLVH